MPLITASRADSEVLRRRRVYAETEMSFARSSGSTGGAIEVVDRTVPSQVRLAIRVKLTDWGLSGLIDSTQLLATELVTNAFEHGRGDVGVRLYLTATHLVIEVRDGSHRRPEPANTALDDEDGRGLLIVASIADDWGVSRDGTTTWCALPHREGTTTMEEGGIVAIPGPVRDEPVWTRHWKLRAGRHAAGNARRYTRLYLTLADVLVDVEDAAEVGGVLMANAVMHSGVPEYAEIPMRCTLLKTGELVIQVHDARIDFPGFDEAVAWEPAQGEKPRGLWTARQLGAEIAYAPTESGKVVQALIRPPDISI
ncbi:ATP-binding protein [Streptomyces sp. NPDC088747]|uniref:ATP-binding protein n=1 Tax=Streptomyces sp. NPDC088747 TaxID=3365886 RepID=UPI00381C120F